MSGLVSRIVIGAAMKSWFMMSPKKVTTKMQHIPEGKLKTRASYELSRQKKSKKRAWSRIDKYVVHSHVQGGIMSITQTKHNISDIVVCVNNKPLNRLKY